MQALIANHEPHWHVTSSIADPHAAFTCHHLPQGPARSISDVGCQAGSSGLATAAGPAAVEQRSPPHETSTSPDPHILATAEQTAATRREGATASSGPASSPSSMSASTSEDSVTRAVHDLLLAAGRPADAPPSPVPAQQHPPLAAVDAAPTPPGRTLPAAEHVEVLPPPSSQGAAGGGQRPPAQWIDAGSLMLAHRAPSFEPWDAREASLAWQDDGMPHAGQQQAPTLVIRTAAGFADVRDAAVAADQLAQVGQHIFGPLYNPSV